VGRQSHKKDWLCAEFTSRRGMAKLKMAESNDFRKEVAMTSALIVIALLILRVGIPVTILLVVGEAVRRQNEKSSVLRGA
jgi:hypothetical protein